MRPFNMGARGEQMFLENKLRQSTVRVNGDVIGTGFFIGNDGSLLTCFHVVRDSKTGKLSDKPLFVVFKQKKYEAECRFISHTPDVLDFAILQLTDGKLPSGAILLPLGEWKSRSGGASRTFSTLGFRSPDDFEGLPAEGAIRDYTIKDSVEFLHLAPEAKGAVEIRPGMSGAPVYYEATGQVVGMISSRFKSPEENIPLAIPIERIAEFWLPLKERLREEEILQQLPKVLNNRFFTDESFKDFYKTLPLPNRRRYEQLGEDKFQALIDQVRMTGRVYECIDWISFKTPIRPHKYIKLPTDINFVNRNNELEQACGLDAKPYILYDAPSGFGKTELLKAISLRHFRNDWLSIGVIEIPEGISSARELIKIIFERAGYAEQYFPHLTIEAAGVALATLLRERINNSHFSGIVLLVDNIERLPKSEINTFINKFLNTIKSMLYKINLRICLAGRYIESAWDWSTDEFEEFIVTPLTPFRFRYVKETVRILLPSLKGPETLAAHLMYMTGGHPGCMAQIIKKIDPTQQVEEILQNNYDSFKEIVQNVASETRNAIPAHLQNVFDTLSIFRRYNIRLLQLIKGKGVLEYSGNVLRLEEELTATKLVNRWGGFIQDEIVRRLLVMRLHWEEPKRFIDLCTLATQIYKQHLQTAISQPEQIALEGLYQELQAGYYQGDKTLQARKSLSALFFDEKGILYLYLKELAAKSDPDAIANFKKLLQNEDINWEFQFAMNFYLRETQYCNDPYEKFCNQVSDIFAQLRREQ